MEKQLTLINQSLHSMKEKIKKNILLIFGNEDAIVSKKLYNNSIFDFLYSSICNIYVSSKNILPYKFLHDGRHFLNLGIVYSLQNSEIEKDPSKFEIELNNIKFRPLIFETELYSVIEMADQYLVAVSLFNTANNSLHDEYVIMNKKASESSISVSGSIIVLVLVISIQVILCVGYYLFTTLKTKFSKQADTKNIISEIKLEETGLSKEKSMQIE